MRDLMQPLRDEHKRLMPHLENLRKTADTIDEADVATVRAAIDDDCKFLIYQLLPHAHAEEEVLYPLITQLIGSPDSTATMQRDHLEVASMIEELSNLRDDLSGGPLTRQMARDFRRVLYGLYALLQTHFLKEEEIYVPILERKLTHQAAQDLFREMEDSAHAAEAHAST